MTREKRISDGYLTRRPTCYAIVGKVSAPAQAKQIKSVRLAVGTRELLAERAEKLATSPGLLLEQLVACAHGVIVLGEPVGLAGVFIERLRWYVAQQQHPPAEVRTSYALGAAFVDGIRQLRDGLGLPRMDLVVEYLIRAACDVPLGDPPSGDDELARRRWAGSQNLHFQLFPQFAAQQPAAQSAAPQQSAAQVLPDRGPLVPPEGNPGD